MRSKKVPLKFYGSVKLTIQMESQLILALIKSY